MTARTLRFEPTDLHALEQEMADNLRAGGCFVQGAAGLRPTEPCALELVHPCDGAVLPLAARVVWVSTDAPPVGVGLTLEGFDEVLRRRLEHFVTGHASAQQPVATATRSAVADGATPDAVAAAAPATSPERTHAAPLAERLRGLSTIEQLKIARGGEAHERAVLERIYGKAVWPALVSNPRLTVPEVARLARMGNLPRPQLDAIVSTSAWLQSPQVRRALLSNPRLTGEMIRRVLRVTPKHELKQMVAQTAYPHNVRAAARELLRR